MSEDKRPRRPKVVHVITDKLLVNVDQFGAIHFYHQTIGTPGEKLGALSLYQMKKLHKLLQNCIDFAERT